MQCALAVQLRVFHYDAFHRIGNMLTGVHAFFQINIYFPPNYYHDRVVTCGMEISHAGNKKLIGFFLKGVDIDYLFVELFGVLETRKLFQHFF